MDGKTLKAAFDLKIGDNIQVHKEGFYMQFEVVMLIGKRVSATLARPCYNNLTPEAEMMKYDSWFVGKSATEIREKGVGRPTKRERREIEEFKDPDESSMLNIELDWDD